MSRAGCYAGSQRPESRHPREDRGLAVLVREAHERRRMTYGRPRGHVELTERGERVGRNRIIRLVEQEELEARVCVTCRAGNHHDALCGCRSPKKFLPRSDSAPFHR